MRISKALLLCAWILAFSAGGPEAQAQGPLLGMNCAARFSKLDLDGDGKVTFQEFTNIPHPEGRPDWVFNLKDANKDGSLTQKEYCAGRGKKKNKSKGT